MKRKKKNNNIVHRVERHIIVKDEGIDALCFLSKNLYNHTNYCLRQSFFNTGKLPKDEDLIKKLTRRNQFDYRMLPAQTSQQTIKLLYKSWKSWFSALKEYKKNPEKFKAKPKPPKYKHKSKGRNLIAFTNQQVKLKDGYIH